MTGERVTWTARCCCTQCVHLWDRETDDPPGTLLMVDCPKCRGRSWEVLAVATRQNTPASPFAANLAKASKAASA